MLDELKKLNYPGRKEDLIYFLQSIVGSKNLKASDIYVLCAHAPAGYQLRAEALINYCTCFGWILQRENIVVCAEIQSVVDNAARLNYYLIESSLEILFKYDVLTADMFIYDIHRHKVSFRNELLPLSYASIRNVLVSQEFLSVDREQKKTTFWVHPNFESMLAQFCKKSSTTLSLKQLQARLEADAIAGAKAESFVLKYERRRICNPVLQRHELLNMDTFDDFRNFEKEALLEIVLRSVRGMGDAGVNYMFMMAGDPNRCKPDVHIHRCIKNALGTDVPNNECQILFRETVKKLKDSGYPDLTVRNLDSVIWNKYQKNRSIF